MISAALPTVTTAVGPHDKRIRAKGTWQGLMRTTVEIRDFSFDIDEPVAVGGTNSAPTPMEFIAGALNGCVSVVVEQVAKELQIGFTALETYSIATQDTRGFAGTAEVSPFFHSYRLEIHVETLLDDPAAQQELTKQVHRRCPAINLVKSAGVNLDINWVFAAQVVPGSAENACNIALGYTPRAAASVAAGASA
ncbi:OsmC family protein [Paeniglutamicibacter gangotriensis]|uniref:OsmC family protein n=2 Tax=Paeniglutamicibacter gangotriensis TaxID=254787 RepID=A0A5B0EFZ7_9MICC|nr:OsmC family protein [Paeniglutamicibacter gangotriensis]